MYFINYICPAFDIGTVQEVITVIENMNDMNVDWPRDMYIFPNELFKCKIVMQVFYHNCTRGCGRVRLIMSLFQQNKIPVFDNQIHITRLKVNLGHGEQFEYVEHMVVEQRHIIINVDPKYNLTDAIQVKLAINPMGQLALPDYSTAKLSKAE